jgi:phosphoglycolate phosphatase
MDAVKTPERRMLLLWDVDHTLIENGGVSKENYRLAFRILTGHDPLVQPQTNGCTDVGIMESMLVANGVSLDAFSNAERLSAVERAGRENAPALPRRGRALVGAARALECLSGQPSVIQSVLTGNIGANALVKLSAFNLDQWIDFSVAGFGETFTERGRLVAVAQGKAARKYGFDSLREVTVVVGDTVRDVAAGLFGRAKVLGVGTGETTVEELLAAGAHEVLADLSDTAVVISTLARVADVTLSGPAGESRS